ncbi:hypothetical protein JW960_23810 [candidate division KSB1 bacterium]|nr:hypothetical protein [candidate division KSB1 bacterium]
MGKAILLILAGISFTITSGLMTQQNRMSMQHEQMVEEYGQIGALNMATSGMNLALSKISRNFNWRDGYDETSSNEGSFEVSINDMDSLVRLTSVGHVASYTNQVSVDLKLTSEVGLQAIYATGDVDKVTPLDENRNVDSTLMVTNASEMPYIDILGLATKADSQGHYFGDPNDLVKPPDGYPNGSFYADSAAGIPNITYIKGDMKVSGGTHIYGIFIVEKDIVINGSARVEGVLYMLNPTSEVIYEMDFTGGGSPSESSVVGGILANGDISGTGNHVSIQYNPEYLELFGDVGGSKKIMKILSWND